MSVGREKDSRSLTSAGWDLSFYFNALQFFFMLMLVVPHGNNVHNLKSISAVVIIVSLLIYCYYYM